MLILRNKTNDKEKNNELVKVIISRLENLKEEIKNMSKKEKKIKNPDKRVNIVEMILKFNKQNQQGKGFKILTPNQMLSRLPIALAQLKQEIILKRLKMKSENYCILFIVKKNMTNQVYSNLINYI